MTVLDVDFVRSCFPAFSNSLPAKTAFFENAGGSYVAGPVLDQLVHFYTHNKVQPYGASEICAAAGEQMDAGRQVMADLLGINKSSLTLGPSTTQNINTLANACGKNIKPGNSVIVTGQDHEANIGAWERLCRRNGATLKVWMVDSKSGELQLEQFEELLDESVSVVCMTHSSNIVGTVNPVEKVIEMCKAQSTRVVVDGVSFAPHKWPDIPTLLPDAYCFSSYKTYATHLGVMYVAPDWAEELDPQCHYFNIEYPEKRFDAAGPDHASIAALSGLGTYFSSSYEHHFNNNDGSLYSKAQQVSDLMHAHETAICASLLEGIEDLPVRIIGKASMDNREANIALVSKQHTSQVMSEAMARNDIAAGNGNFYAMRLLQNVGISDTEDGVLRISISHYNTIEEIHRVVATMRSLFQ